ncbi:MAG: phospholipid-binding lipoprotein MlaA [Alphaproteobacteria bacterium]|nr:phospholipid-binding lipoprotein MlaA [Alphaproteobacteria bacterium]
MIDPDLTRLTRIFVAMTGVITGLSIATPAAIAQEPASANAGEAEEADVNDPFEPMNRFFFSFNLAMDKVILRPAAIAYRAVLPAPVRESTSNFLDNLESPVIFLNDLLQAKPARAGNTLARFGINTVIGFFGFFDPAESMGMERHDEDFAQTLGAWGVSSGPYLMLPFLGPLPPRDMVGFAGDFFTDPMTYLLWDHRTTNLVYYGVDVVDQRHQVIDEFDELEKSSVDYYAAIRSLYRQRMDDRIRDGKTDMENLPVFDDEDGGAP